MLEASKVIKDGKPERAAHFWAMVVWNYSTNRCEILEITQKTIQERIGKLSVMKAWGSPINEYDLVVTKESVNGKITYTTTANPKEPNTPDMKADMESNPINLKALLTGDNPFSIEPQSIEESLDAIFPPK